MGGSSLYDEDVYAWAEQQVRALRALEARRDLPNELDLTNVIEEIEDVGKGELCTVNILLGQILTQLICVRTDPAREDPRGWAADVIGWLSDVGRRITPSMRDVIDLDELWRDAIQVAAAKLDIHGRAEAQMAASLAALKCPLSLDDLCSRSYDVRTLLEKIPAPQTPAAT